jgi:hypothetical protein
MTLGEMSVGRPRLWGFILVALVAALVFGCSHGYRLPRTAGVDARAQVDNGLKLGETRFRPSVCEGLDLKPEYTNLDERSIDGFLKQHGFPVRIVRARSDLFYVEFQLNPDRDEWVRLRVATLASAHEAGEELHRAILQNGNGSWGVHRSNLAILGPIGDLDAIIALTAKTKLSCWGVLTVAANKTDAFVVPGGYREL